MIQIPVLGFHLKGKYQIKAALQIILFASLVAGYGVFNFFLSSNDESREGRTSIDYEHFQRRVLQESNNPAPTTTTAPTPVPCDSLDKADPAWLAAFYFLGVLYMFLALAIACDEFFVPALEEMSSPRRLNLSMDVAGKIHYNVEWELYKRCAD
jgi:sodium/potassium/calcium exchanger 2